MRKIKIIYYRGLLDAKYRILTTSERILYCFLVARAVQVYYEAFVPTPEDYNEEDSGKYYEIEKYESRYLAELLHMTDRTVRNAMKSLKAHRLIKDGYVKITKDIFEKGYFSLKNKKISGELWIFYSWLCDMGQGLGVSKLNISQKKMAELYGVNIGNIKQYIHEIKHK